MDREQLIEKLVEMNLPYQIVTLKTFDGRDYEQIYVFERETYDKKKKHPKRYKDLYIPYLRVSWPEGLCYTKFNGWTQYANEQYVLEALERLRKIA